MVEHTRTHPRLKEDRPAGVRQPLTVGTLFLPEKLPPGRSPLLIHFHGGSWIPEVAAATVPCAVVAVQLGAGSSVYAKPFVEPAAFARLLEVLELDPETAAGGLETLLKAPLPCVRFGAAVGLALLGRSAGAEALRATIHRALPPAYVIALQVLALSEPELVVPLLAPFALAPPPASLQPLPDAQLGVVSRAPS